MSTLQLSVHGPFLYRFTRNQVELYAAKCPGHTAGLATAKNEVRLTGRQRYGNARSYRISGPVFAPSSPIPSVRFHDPGNAILDVPAGATPVFEEAWFCLIAPLPQLVVPLLPNDVEIINNSTNPPGKPTGVLSPRATGLRFYYDADLSKNLMLTLDGSLAPAWIADFDAPVLGQDFADAEIRYASVWPEARQHQDALDCFEYVAKLSGVDLWACYDDPTNPHGPQPFLERGHDCKGAILAIR